MTQNLKFDYANSKTNLFYNEYGFIHYQPSSSEFKSLIDKCYNYYLNNDRHNNLQKNFVGQDGAARHILDIFRDKYSPALEIYKHKEVKQLISLLNENKELGIFTHSKLSFKEPNKITDWYPHQDNGYKKLNDRRSGLAIFICLEKMNNNNGCLQLFPKSHRLKTLKHERIVENLKSGSYQLRISNLPSLSHISIEAEAGDIILFHNDMIHQSQSSSTNSYRFALIAEIEFSKKIKLDDYNLVPVVAAEFHTLMDKIYLFFLSLINLRNKWYFFKKYFPSCSFFIKKWKVYIIYNLLRKGSK